MNGKIFSACGPLCPCGGAFEKKNDPITKINYPACRLCGLPPRRLRVRKIFPDQNGKAFEKDYEVNPNTGRALESVLDCVELIGQLNKEIHSTDYRPEKFNKKDHDKLSFKVVAEKYLSWTEERLGYPQGHDDYIAKGARDTLVNNVKNHLIPKLSEKTVLDSYGSKVLKDNGEEEKVTVYIYEIDEDTVIDFYKSYTKHFRAREKATGELKTLMNFAKRKKLIKEVPNFPKLKRAREITLEEIPELDVQEKIISLIKNEMYRFMYTLQALLLSRPCETVLFNVEDVDYSKNGIWIRKHLSGGVITPGRKSIIASEELGVVFYELDSYILEGLKQYTFGKMPSDPLFPGEKCKYVSLTTFRTAWQKARKLAGHTVTSYVGTKHASATDFRTKNGTDRLSSKLKHKDAKTSLRYGKDRSEGNEIVDSSRFNVGFMGGQAVGEEFSNILSFRKH